MLRFFRQIRQKLMEQNKVRTYLLYAFGEIALVMIGILLALQVNNWNQKQTEDAQLHNYYERINEELEADLLIQLGFLERNQMIINLNKRTLELLKMEHPDSLNQLKFTLGAIATAWSSKLSYPVLNEFISNGYLSRVDNPVLKQTFTEVNAQIEFARTMDNYIQQQYLNTIEPYVIRSFNYQSVALDRYQSFLVTGGPAVDYTTLKGDLELWNIATFKLEISLLYDEYLKEMVAVQKELSELIIEELE
jgi:hypothetical protein